MPIKFGRVVRSGGYRSLAISIDVVRMRLQETADHHLYPNPASHLVMTNGDHLRYYEFLGKILGKVSGYKVGVFSRGFRSGWVNLAFFSPSLALAEHSSSLLLVSFTQMLLFCLSAAARSEDGRIEWRGVACISESMWACLLKPCGLLSRVDVFCRFAGDV